MSHPNLSIFNPPPPPPAPDFSGQMIKHTFKACFRHAGEGSGEIQRHTMGCTISNCGGEMIKFLIFLHANTSLF